MQCLQCNQNPIQYWCLDRFCENNLICDQCKERHGLREEIFHQNVINTDRQKLLIMVWVKKVQKKLLNMLYRIFYFSNTIKDKFEKIEQNSQEQNSINLLKQKLQLYLQYLQSKPKIECAILNLNNQLSECNFPNMYNIDDPQYIEQINNCKKLIQEKSLIKAQQQILNLNPEEATYFQIECYILQKKFRDALKLSTQTLDNLNRNPEHKDLKFQLQIQKAKILHKQQEYQQAIHVLKNINKDGLNDEYKVRLKLQLAKTYMKCGQFNIGFNQIINIRRNYTQIINPQPVLSNYDRLQQNLENEFKQLIQKKKQNNLPPNEIEELNNRFQENHQKNMYFIDNFSYSLALAKANLLQFKGVRQSVNLNFSLIDESIEPDSQLLQSGNSENIPQNESENQQNQNDMSILYKVQEIYQHILQEEPTNQKALFGLSQIYMKQRNYKEAREILYQLYQLNPKCGKAEIGLIYIRERLLEEDQNNMEEQASNIEGCLGFIVKWCQDFSNRIHPEG